MAVAIPLVFGLGGAWAGGAIGGWFGLAAVGSSVGFLGGQLIGNFLFPGKSSSTNMPKIGSYSFQSSTVGGAVPIVFGSRKLAGNVVWLGESHPYRIEHEASGGKGGGGGSVAYETRYRKSFLIVLCEGPATVRRMWKGKKEVPLTEAVLFDGGTSENVGLQALVGEEFAHYKHICCAFFDEYELGNADSLPNFTFEVSSGEWPQRVVLAKGRPSSGYQVYYSINELFDIGDGTFTVGGSVENGTDGGRVVGFDGEYFYAIDGDYLEKYDINMNPVTSWQTNGRKYFLYLGESTCLVNQVTGCVLVYAYYYVYYLDPDGNELWSRNITSVAKAVFTLSGDILISRLGNSGPGGYKLSVVDGSTLATYATNISESGIGSASGISENPVTKQIILAATFNGVTGLHAWPPSGGYLADMLWQRASPGGNLYCVTCTHDGFIFAGGYPSGAGSLHKFSKAGVVLKSYKTWDHVFSIVQRDYRTIITGGGRGIKGVRANVRVFSIEDLSYLRGYDYGPNDYGSNFVYDFALPIAPLIDVNPVDVIYALLTNTRYGAGIAVDYIDQDSFDEVWQYCEDNGLKFSFEIDSQRPVMDWIDFINSHFFGYLVPSQGKIKMGCYRAQSPVFEVLETDLLSGGELGSPLDVKKREYKETANSLRVTWTNREKDYAEGIVVASDELDQQISGKIRKRETNLNGITNSVLAQKIVGRLLTESMFRYTLYSFKVGYRKMCIEPGDVGVLSDGVKVIRQRIRILNKKESPDGKEVSLEAIEDRPELYSFVISTATDNEHSQDEEPTLVSPKVAFTESFIEPIVHLHIAAQSEQVNGYAVYRSYDNETYEFLEYCSVDVSVGGNVYGVLSTKMSSCPVVMHLPSESFNIDVGTFGTPLDTSDTLFFYNKHLAKVGDEVIAYKSVYDLGSGIWKISELIRGLFNTEAVAHPVGTEFHTLDFNFKYTSSDFDIGKTLYFKVLPFYGQSIQPLEDATPFSYEVVGLYKRPAPVTALRISGREGMNDYTGASVTLNWNLASLFTGFNNGGFNWDNSTFWYWTQVRELSGESPPYHDGISCDYYLADTLLEKVFLQVEDMSGNLLVEYELGSTIETKALDVVADFGSLNPVRVKVFPASGYQALRENEIILDIL